MRVETDLGFWRAAPCRLRVKILISNSLRGLDGSLLVPLKPSLLLGTLVWGGHTRTRYTHLEEVVSPGEWLGVETVDVRSEHVVHAGVAADSVSAALAEREAAASHWKKKVLTPLPFRFYISNNAGDI